MRALKSAGPPDAHRERETGTVARVVLLLRALADIDEPPTMKVLADTVNLPLSTMHRLLELLAVDHIVERDEATRTFRPGTEYLRLAARVVQRMPLAALARPFLASASQEANESAYLGMLDGKAGKLRFVACAMSKQILDYRVPLNEPIALVVGASGLSILAWLDAVTIGAILSAERLEGELTVPTRKALLPGLAQIREQGYANTFGQRIKGSVGFFAPVFDSAGAVCACFGFTVPQSRFDPRESDTIAEIVVRHAGGLSNALGYSGRYPRPSQTYGSPR